MDPRCAYDISMRLPHLPLRVKEHSRRAAALAERLVRRGLRVVYPGLPDHLDHGLLGRLANAGYGAGGILGLDVGSTERANRLMETLQNRDRFGFMAVSLGYFETLMSCSAASTSSELGDDALARAGIAPGLVRMSVGYTGSLEQRWRQLEEGLEELGLGSE
jgi:methionine-gamma-lyase